MWRGKKNALVFDSIEITPDTSIHTNTKLIVIHLVRDAARQLVEQYNIEQVLCGEISDISETVAITDSFTPEQFRDYKGYSDAKNQRVLRDKKRPFYFFEVDDKGTQVTLDWITEKLENKAPLSDQDSLWESLNWAILSENQNLIDTIKNLATQKATHRLKKINNLINNLERHIKYIINDNIVNNIMNDSFPLEARDEAGMTPLMRVTLLKNINNVLNIIKKGANLESINAFGQTALLYAAENTCSEEMFIILIKAGSNLEHSNYFGDTALMSAIQSRNTKKAIILIKENVNLDHINNDGKTALQLAIDMDNKEIINAIKKRLEAIQSENLVPELAQPESKNEPETKTEWAEPPELEVTISHRRPSR